MRREVDVLESAINPTHFKNNFETINHHLSGIVRD